MFAIKAELSDSWAETFAFSAQKTMYGGRHIAKGDTIFVFASENEGGPGLVASGVVTSTKAIAKKTRDRPANAAREHHHQTHRARKAAPGAERAQSFFRLEGRSTRDRAQFQILSSGNEQDCGHLGSSGGVPPRILLTREFRHEHDMAFTRRLIFKVLDRSAFSRHAYAHHQTESRNTHLQANTARGA